MVLNCPQCKMSATYVRGDISGKWVVCHHCEVPFAWQDARKPATAPRPNTPNSRVSLKEKA